MRNSIRWSLVNALVNATLLLEVTGIYLFFARAASDSAGSLSGWALTVGLVQLQPTIEGFIRFLFIYTLLLFGVVVLLKFRIPGAKIVAFVIAIPGIFLPWGTFGAYATIVSLFDREPRSVAALPEQENALA